MEGEDSRFFRAVAPQCWPGSSSSICQQQVNCCPTDGALVCIATLAVRKSRSRRGGSSSLSGSQVSGEPCGYRFMRRDWPRLLSQPLPCVGPQRHGPPRFDLTWLPRPLGRNAWEQSHTTRLVMVGSFCQTDRTERHCSPRFPLLFQIQICSRPTDSRLNKSPRGCPKRDFSTISWQVAADLAVVKVYQGLNVISMAYHHSLDVFPAPCHSDLIFPLSKPSLAAC